MGIPIKSKLIDDFMKNNVYVERAIHLFLQIDTYCLLIFLLYILAGANQDIRDYSGKKPRQYSISQKAAVSQDTMRSKYLVTELYDRDFLYQDIYNWIVIAGIEFFSCLISRGI